MSLRTLSSKSMNPTNPLLVRDDTIRAIHAQVMENMRKLQGCKHPHELERVTDPARPDSPFKKWRCTKCGGTFSNSDGLRYNEGLKHAREELHVFLRDVANNWDCDSGAHGVHSPHCRACEAKGLLCSPDSPSPSSSAS